MINEIRQKLAQNGYSVSQKNISEYLQEFETSQKYFPKIEQYVLMIRLLEEWKVRSLEKILILFSEHTIDSQFPIAISFGW
jgi:arginine repressor